MDGNAQSEQRGGLGRGWYIALFVFSTAIGLAILACYPVIYGGDPILRVTNWERLRLAYQLPMIQVVVHLATRIHPDPAFLRVVLIAIAALGACGMARLAGVAFGDRNGIYAGLFFASNHFLIYLGNSPYQEMLELALLLWGLALIFGTGHPELSLRRGAGHPERSLRAGAARVLGYTLLALACLTRYEAWFVAAAAALVCSKPRVTDTSERRRGIAAAARIALPFAAGPLAWVLINGGLSPSGTSLLDPAFRLARLWRIPYVIGATLNHATSAVALFALLGVVLWLRDPRRRKNPVAATLLLAGVFFLLALPLTSMGVLPDLDRYVTNREAHFLLPALFLMAALGLSWVVRRLPLAPLSLMFLLVFAYEGYSAKKIMDQSVSEGNLQLDAALARLLTARLQPGETALIFARPFAAEPEPFMDMIRRRRGEEGVRAAREMMAGLHTWPFDYARIWVHAPRLRGRLLLAQQTAALDPQTRIAVVFEDFEPANAAEQALLESLRRSAPAERHAPFTAGRPGALVYSMSPSGGNSQ